MKSLKVGKAHVEVWPSAGAALTRAAELFAETARQSIAWRDEFTVALSGGSTPRALYELLAGEVYAPRIPWAGVHVFWGDERCVPPASEESNYRTAHEALLARVPIPESQIHRMRGEDEPLEAARAYERVLLEKFEENPPRFDLILLGMGEDGHTASLFPHSEALDETERWVAAPYVEKLGAHRLTLTLPVINRARRVIFLVAGEAKAAALHTVLESDADPRDWPARLVRPVEGGELIWLVDQEAATQLSF